MSTDIVEPTVPEPLRSKHTSNSPALLERPGISLAVTTYQAGKLVMVRDEENRLNTQFRVFQAPMGMALGCDRLALGATMQLWEFVNVPAVVARLDPPGRRDACFLPRSSHVTGNILIRAGEPTLRAARLTGNGGSPRGAFGRLSEVSLQPRLFNTREAIEP